MSYRVTISKSLIQCAFLQVLLPNFDYYFADFRKAA